MADVQVHFSQDGQEFLTVELFVVVLVEVGVELDKGVERLSDLSVEFLDGGVVLDRHETVVIVHLARRDRVGLALFWLDRQGVGVTLLLAECLHHAAELGHRGPPLGIFFQTVDNDLAQGVAVISPDIFYGLLEVFQELRVPPAAQVLECTR